MDEYIERDKALREIDHSLNLSEAYSKIAEMPAANNVTKVVRCKSCRYSKWSEKNQKYYCQRRWAMRGVRERDFCSYGKKEGQRCD